MPRSSGGGGLSFHTEWLADHELIELGRYLRHEDKKFAAALRKELRDGVREAGQKVLDAVKERASWSTRIPAATTMSVSLAAKSAGVVIRTSAKRAPHARPLDQGSQGGGGTVDRHPVFGRGDQTRDEWTWVEQPTRPFFSAAAEASTPEIEARMRRVMDDVARKAGFR